MTAIKRCPFQTLPLNQRAWVLRASCVYLIMMRAVKQTLIYLSLLALLAFPLLVYLNAQALSDWWQLRDYTPPPAVASLATQDTRTPYARHIFYVNHPDIQSDAAQFRNDCHENEKTIVLGCYHSDQQGIFLYNVQDERLTGEQQVTAAHEMLHAAYDRLSSKDKNYVNGLLQGYYDKNLKDQRIIDTINSYRQSEPDDIVNEMHSIFGTEIASLPPPLENYYARYFTNRGLIANYASSYENEFTSRENQIKSLNAQLSDMKTQIDAQKQSLQVMLNQINADRARLESLRSAGQIEQYNAGVADFNAEVNQYNSGVSQLRSEINTYNKLVDQYNSIAKELASLQKAIDTRLVPQAAQ